MHARACSQRHTARHNTTHRSTLVIPMCQGALLEGSPQCPEPNGPQAHPIHGRSLRVRGWHTREGKTGSGANASAHKHTCTAGSIDRYGGSPASIPLVFSLSLSLHIARPTEGLRWWCNLQRCCKLHSLSRYGEVEGEVEGATDGIRCAGGEGSAKT